MDEPFEMSDLGKKYYPVVGKCIYCSSTEGLSDEHIVPAALNGTGVLRKASCEVCREITGDFEQEILRGVLWPMRVAKGLRSRTKHGDAPKTTKIQVADREGNESTLEVAFGETPFSMFLPNFALPAAIDPTGYTHGIRLGGPPQLWTIGGTPEEVIAKYGGQKVTLTQTIIPVSYAKMLAKIAYSMAYAEGVLDRVEDVAPLVSDIIGKTETIGRWVGMTADPILKHDGELHRVLFNYDLERRLIFAVVQLFAGDGLPAYVVVLGNLRTQ